MTFFQASLGMEQESNLWTAQLFKILGCKFTLWMASAMPRTGRERWRVQTKDLWPPALGPHSSLCLETTTNAISRYWGKPYPLQSSCNLGGEGCHEHLLLLQLPSTINACLLHGEPGHAAEAQGQGWSPYGCSSALDPWFISPGFKVF